MAAAESGSFVPTMTAREDRPTDMARLDHDFAGLSLESSAGKDLSSSPLLGYEIDSALSSGAGFAGRIAVANAKWKPQDKRAVIGA